LTKTTTWTKTKIKIKISTKNKMTNSRDERSISTRDGISNDKCDKRGT